MPVLAVLLCCVVGITQVPAPLHSQLDHAPAASSLLTEAVDLSLDEVQERWRMKETLNGILFGNMRGGRTFLTSENGEVFSVFY